MTLRVPRRPGVLVCALLVALAAVPVAHAQVLYGSIVGNVTDSTGAALPGATVTIEQSETKLKRELVTDAGGRLSLHGRAVRHLHGLGHDDRVPHVQPPQRAGHAELGGARRREAGGRPAHRDRDGDRPSRRSSRPTAPRCGRS